MELQEGEQPCAKHPTRVDAAGGSSAAEPAQALDFSALCAPLSWAACTAGMCDCSSDQQQNGIASVI